MSFSGEKYKECCRFTHVPVFIKLGTWVIFLYSVSSCALFKPVAPSPVTNDEHVFLNEKEENISSEKEIERRNLIPYWKQRTSNTPVENKAISNAGVRFEIIREAEKYIGTPYTWAGKSPETGFDCSGFTAFIMRKFNYFISPSSKEQAKSGISITFEESKPGDLIIFRNEKNEVFHVSFITRIEPQVLEVIHSVNGGVKKENLFNNTWWMNKKMEVRSIIPD
jgi:hypothetical protein